MIKGVPKILGIRKYFTHFVGAKTCQCAEHIASPKDLLDGARLEIRLASTQD